MFVNVERIVNFFTMKSFKLSILEKESEILHTLAL
jgi:hypothetical protein